MIENTRNDFTGNLKLWDIQCTFLFSYTCGLRITPLGNMKDAFKTKVIESEGCFDNLGWLFGIDSNDYDIAFLLSDIQGPLSYHNGNLLLSVDILLASIPKRDTNNQPLHHNIDAFRTIDFYGSPVDSVFSPLCALCRENPSRYQITLRPEHDYSKIFPTTINGQQCSLIFTVFVDRNLLYDDTSLGTLHSILRLEFDEKQSIASIPDCWSSVCYFLEFCTGNHNISDLGISLGNAPHLIRDKGTPGYITCNFTEDFPENIPFRSTPTYRFQVDSLGAKVGSLFGLLSDSQIRPKLGFSQKTNTDIGIDSYKIRDLCTAYEAEYLIREEEFPYHEADELVAFLKTTLRKHKHDHPDKVGAELYSSACNSLTFISRPAKVKIAKIFLKYRSFIDERLSLYYQYQNAFVLTDEQAKKDIQWLVSVRNKITHAGDIKESNIPNTIFFRLKLGIYCSTLERAGYSLDEISQIIADYFNM